MGNDKKHKKKRKKKIAIAAAIGAGAVGTKYIQSSRQAAELYDQITDEKRQYKHCYHNDPKTKRYAQKRASESQRNLRKNTTKYGKHLIAKNLKKQRSK